MRLGGTQVRWLDEREDFPGTVFRGTGYLSVVLHAVQYAPRTTRWQSVFGGADRVVLSSKLTHRYSNETTEALSIHSVDSLSSGNAHHLPIGRILALNVPCDCEALEIGFEIRAVRSDRFSDALKLLSSEEIRKPLEIAGPVIGHVMAISTLVRRVFDSDDRAAVVLGSFPGLLPQPGQSGTPRETTMRAGMLAMVALQPSADPLGAPDQTLSLVDTHLCRGTERVEDTYAVFSISTQSIRGPAPRSAWHRKYGEAIGALDRLHTCAESERSAVVAAAESLWLEGSALLAHDMGYLDSEKSSIRRSALSQLRTRVKEIEPVATRHHAKPDVIDAIEFEAAGNDARALLQSSDEVLAESAVSYDRSLERHGLAFRFS